MTSSTIRRIRDNLDLTQGQLADLLGVHPLTVSKWERGLLSPNQHQIQLLREFRKAGERDLDDNISDLLVTAGVTVALLALLKAALD